MNVHPVSELGSLSMPKRSKRPWSESLGVASSLGSFNQSLSEPRRMSGGPGCTPAKTAMPTGVTTWSELWHPITSQVEYIWNIIFWYILQVEMKWVSEQVVAAIRACSCLLQNSSMWPSWWWIPTELFQSYHGPTRTTRTTRTTWTTWTTRTTRANRNWSCSSLGWPHVQSSREQRDQCLCTVSVSQVEKTWSQGTVAIAGGWTDGSGVVWVPCQVGLEIARQISSNHAEKQKFQNVPRCSKPSKHHVLIIFSILFLIISFNFPWFSIVFTLLPSIYGDLLDGIHCSFRLSQMSIRCKNMCTASAQERIFAPCGYV